MVAAVAVEVQVSASKYILLLCVMKLTVYLHITKNFLSKREPCVVRSGAETSSVHVKYQFLVILFVLSVYKLLSYKCKSFKIGVIISLWNWRVSLSHQVKMFLKYSKKENRKQS